MRTRHRKTRRRYENLNEVRCLTFSCYGRLPLFNNDRVKDAFVDAIASARERTAFELIAWVIMPEHVHLMILPWLPEYPVAAVLKALKGGMANRALRRWRELNAPILRRITARNGKCHFWQVGGGYDRNIYSDKEFFEKLDYIHDNPVTRGLVKYPTEWRWSSARWYDGQTGGGILPIDAIWV